jgi:DNA-binding beta-propeller fold protein YncE
MKKNTLRIFVMVMLSLTPIFLVSQAVLAEITEFTPSDYQAAALVLGQPNFTSSAAATTQIGMSNPYDVTVDPTTSKVFVADENNNRVLRFASLATLSNGLAAEAVLGQEDFVSGLPNRGGAVAANTMNNPVGLSVDSGGRLWVADVVNNRVLRFDNAASKANGADADSVLGQPDMTSNTFATTQNQMSQPSSLFADLGGRLWVTDYANNRVLRFDDAANKAIGDNADGVLGQTNFVSNAAAITRSGMNNPNSLFFDSSGRLWVADRSNNRVLRFDSAAAKVNGADADGVLGQLDYTSSGTACTQGNMNSPHGVSGDSTGRLYVADRFYHRILVFENAAGLADGANAGFVLGQPNLTTCGLGGLSAASLHSPTRVFFDAAANILWVADSVNNRALLYGNTAPSATLVLGQPDFTSNAIATTQTGMDQPYGVRVDPTTGKVFVADSSNHRVLRFASVTALSNGAAAEAVLGQTDFTSGLQNRGGAVAANTMDTPFGVFVDSAGRLWVADVNNNRVLRFDNAATKPDGADADGVLGQPDFLTNALATTQAGMNSPYDVFVDSSGRLWVADYYNNRVLRFESAASKADGANADGVLGQLDFISNAAATAQNGMRGPAGLHVDLNGRLWVAERNNNRLLRFDDAAAKSDGANADGVLGQANFTSGGSACVQNRMYRPRGVSGDLAGKLYVADGDNHRILIFDDAASLPNGANASDLLGQSNFNTCTSNTGGVSSSSLYTPTRAFFDTATNVLWVADWNNNRVLRYGTPEFRNFLPVVKSSSP